jgi:predicted ATP-binding protein involved in virulence
MKLYAFHLNNTTHFPKLSLSIPEDCPVTVISGAQATGKTTILKNLYHALTWFQGRYRDIKTAGVVMVAQDIHQQALASQLRISIKIPNALHQFNQDLNADERIPRIYTWQLKKAQTANNSISTVETTQLENLVKLYQKAIKHDPDYGLPLIAYYPAERFINEVNLLSKNNPQVLQPIHAYDLASIPYTTFSRFFEWLREAHDIENANSAAYLEQLSQIGLDDFQAKFQLKPLRPHLSALKHSLHTVLPEVEDLILEYQPKIQLKVKVRGQVLLYQQLSNSLKVWIALVGDIVRRLCILNPQQLKPCLVGDGILIIDQIEQQLDEPHCLEILARLEQAFPQLQIIVSTSQAELLQYKSSYQYLKLADLALTPLSTQAQVLDERYAAMYAHLLHDEDHIKNSSPLTDQADRYSELLTQVQQELSPAQQQQLLQELQNSLSSLENLSQSHPDLK